MKRNVANKFSPLLAYYHVGYLRECDNRGTDDDVLITIKRTDLTDIAIEL